ncbi:MAG: DNA-binding response regulator, partial [Caldilineaceae bacterium]|nr:DNA-binding response regulator [Caldilineaceae bacterium]
MPANRLLIIANDPLARAGLAALLGGQEHVTVVGQTNDADLDAVLAVFEPDVLVWDLGWDP